MAILWLAAVSRCDELRSVETTPEPRSGDFVKLRGTLGEDVDCRTLRADGGRTYSLSSRLPNQRNGSKVCVHGTVVDASQCMRTPMIEVQSIRPWSSCP
jgi:hypothetical protein